MYTGGGGVLWGCVTQVCSLYTPHCSSLPATMEPGQVYLPPGHRTSFTWPHTQKLAWAGLGFSFSLSSTLNWAVMSLQHLSISLVTSSQCGTVNLCVNKNYCHVYIRIRDKSFLLPLLCKHKIIISSILSTAASERNSGNSSRLIQLLPVSLSVCLSELMKCHCDNSGWWWWPRGGTSILFISQKFSFEITISHVRKENNKDDCWLSRGRILKEK